MNQPAEPLQLSQKEQGKLLARVYTFILSDQFIGNSRDSGKTSDTKSINMSKTQPQGESQELDVQHLSALEPTG